MRDITLIIFVACCLSFVALNLFVGFLILTLVMHPVAAFGYLVLQFAFPWAIFRFLATHHRLDTIEEN